MRHSRTRAFAEAWGDTPGQRWSALTDDPNDPHAIAHRAHTLQAAWMPPIDDRLEFLAGRCRDKNVLDIGCVAHDASRLNDPAWLHRHLADAAHTCVGVDILADGIAALQAAGFDAVCHDLTRGLGPLADRGRFDVIVAGELIEHVGDLDMLFRVAESALTADGELILTTPNPYAPARVRAGQRGIVWENADHVSYLFPSGVAELAERNGLRLTGATTINSPATHSSPASQLKRLIRGTGWRAVGYNTVDQPGRQAALAPFAFLDKLPLRRSARFVGETFVYVVTPVGGS